VNYKQKTIYCDYCATAPLLPEVRDAMHGAEEKFIGNPSSIHRPGQEAKVALERARASLARAVGAKPKEIVLTSGGTEANNLALFGLLKSGDHVITSEIEHPSILKPLEKLAASGVDVTRITPNPAGEIDPDKVKAAILDQTRLISIMAINNETGVINNMVALGKLAEEYRIAFHSDAVQAFGKIPLDVQSMGIHFLSASAHKLGGPKGMGLLYARQGVAFDPLHLGGSQENHHRGGTENLISAIGFAKAMDQAQHNQSKIEKRLRRLRNLFLDNLADAGSPYTVNGSNAYPGVINIHLPGIDGQSLVINLDAEGFAVSFGSSCASGSAKPSHVLLAMGLCEQSAKQSIRISFGPQTTEEEVLTLVSTLDKVVRRMKGPTNTSPASGERAHA